jgi:hypothetical protein
VQVDELQCSRTCCGGAVVDSPVRLVVVLGRWVGRIFTLGMLSHE